MPNRLRSWALTSLQQRLVKTGGRLVNHSRYYWLLLNDFGILAREVLARGSLTKEFRRLPEAGDVKVARTKAILDMLAWREDSADPARNSIRSPCPARVVGLLGTRNVRHIEDTVTAAREPLDSAVMLEIGG